MIFCLAVGSTAALQSVENELKKRRFRMYQEEEQVEVRRRQGERAVKLAMANRWKDAVSANRAILEVFPNDTDSYNRLGKALMELERFPAAKKAYKKALELDESNQIAKKNLQRITALAKSGGAHSEGVQADPSLFIEEMGKTALTSLERLNADALIKLTAGDRVQLKRKGDGLFVETLGGVTVGSVELRLRSRILKLLDGGSEYAAAVTSLEGEECRVIIKETQRAPDQAGPSFPAAIATMKMRAYTKDSLIEDGTRPEKTSRATSNANSEDGDSDDKTGEDWGDDSIAQEGHVSINDAAAAEDADDEDELEE